MYKWEKYNAVMSLKKLTFWYLNGIKRWKDKKCRRRNMPKKVRKDKKCRKRNMPKKVRKWKNNSVDANNKWKQNGTSETHLSQHCDLWAVEQSFEGAPQSAYCSSSLTFTCSEGWIKANNDKKHKRHKWNQQKNCCL